MTRVHKVAALVLLAAAGCADSPTAPVVAEERSALLADGTQFLACPSQEARSVTGQIGILGGALTVDGHRFEVPALAVLQPTTFTMTAPASEYVELEIHADGRDSFTFLLPAHISISYDRCQDQDIDPATLSVWHIDSLTGALLEFMGGIADADARVVEFSSGHLSGFIIAN